MIDFLAFILVCFIILFPVFVIFWIFLILIELVETPKELKNLLKSRQKPTNKKVLILSWCTCVIAFLGLFEIGYVTFQPIASSSIALSIISIMLFIVASIIVIYLLRSLVRKSKKGD